MLDCAVWITEMGIISREDLVALHYMYPHVHGKTAAGHVLLLCNFDLIGKVVWCAQRALATNTVVPHTRLHNFQFS